jgi:hemerythrin-like metal-binding protein
MSEFTWDDSLSVGVRQMNDEHKGIIQLINRVSNDVDAGTDPLPSFDTLADFVVTHFEHEEAWMDSHQYSGIESHKQIHVRLLARIGEFREQMLRGQVDTAELFTFLRMWLKSHIKGIDQKYGIECAGFHPSEVPSAS